MGALFLRDAGVLRSDATVLDVGAGTESMLFWLARRVARVVAVDVYGLGEFSHREAPAGFADDPAGWAPYEYPRDRLEVQVMDARQLGFADGSFDAVVSFSSIEHFGMRPEIAQAARELGRVLKPGGHAFLVTEAFVRQSALDRIPLRRAGRRSLRPSGDVFTPRELHECVVAPSGLSLLQPLDLSVTRETTRNIQRFTRAGCVNPSADDRYPHILLRGRFGSLFTSVCLPLQKRP
jgi:SAM-dependent methyltransferase